MDYLDKRTELNLAERVVSDDLTSACRGFLAAREEAMGEKTVNYSCIEDAATEFAKHYCDGMSCITRIAASVSDTDLAIMEYIAILDGVVESKSITDLDWHAEVRRITAIISLLHNEESGAEYDYIAACRKEPACFNKNRYDSYQPSPIPAPEFSPK